MPAQEKSPSETSAYPTAPEVLSDEEIRSRAAAYAQRIYEQQLEAYEAQRAQAIEAMRLREEYARRQAAYEEACRAYYAQAQRETKPVVRIDAETGEAVYASNSEATRYTAFPSAQYGVPAPSAGDASEGAVPEIYPEPDNPEAETSADEAAGYDAVSPSDDEIPEKELSAEEEGEPPAETDSGVPASVSGPDAGPPKTVVVIESRFPLISVILTILCVAALSAEGYILFSDDPRFERQRNNFFSAIGWENAVSSEETETNPKPKTLELPELRRKVETSAPAEPVSAPDVPVEPVSSPEETPEEFSEGEELPLDEVFAEDSEETPDYFSDDEF